MVVRKSSGAHFIEIEVSGIAAFESRRSPKPKYPFPAMEVIRIRISTTKSKYLKNEPKAKARREF
jgi:hypothetical protein